MLTSSPVNPIPLNLPVKLPLSPVCITAFPNGSPIVTATVLDKYMKEIAGAIMCAASSPESTACREIKTADCATPVPKPDGKM